jgi:hypothetical protein
MDARLALIKKLKGHPELTYVELPDKFRIAAPTPNGFAVELHGAVNEWTVYLGEAGYHETFSASDEVLNFIAWCYSGEARIREIWRGNWPQKVILEALQGGRWQEDAETGYFFVPFWLPRSEIVRTNPNLLRD